MEPQWGWGPQHPSRAPRRGIWGATETSWHGHMATVSFGLRPAIGEYLGKVAAHTGKTKAPAALPSQKRSAWAPKEGLRVQQGGEPPASKDTTDGTLSTPPHHTSQLRPPQAGQKSTDRWLTAQQLHPAVAGATPLSLRSSEARSAADDTKKRARVQQGGAHSNVGPPAQSPPAPLPPAHGSYARPRPHPENQLLTVLTHRAAQAEAQAWPRCRACPGSSAAPRAPVAGHAAAS